ncbi:MAG: DUF885 domain-containing protein [Bacteroidetes bacterium]|nr:DUF885 domain-containing protein [Bacteroidota bacterium]
MAMLVFSALNCTEIACRATRSTNVDATLAKMHTSTNLSPDEIFNTGISEVARIKEIMMATKDELGYEGLELQQKFDIRAFHDAVLENGSIPLDLLESNVNTWTESLN